MHQPSKQCTNKASNAPTKQAMHQPSKQCTNQASSVSTKQMNTICFVGAAETAAPPGG